MNVSKAEILKSKWYITVREWPLEHIRQVLPQHGAFRTKDGATMAINVSNMNHRFIPFKGDRILKHPELFFVLEQEQST